MAESPLLSPASASPFELEGARVWVAGHRYFRPTEVDLLVGNPAKARDKLGWRHRTTFLDLVKEMVAHDLGQGHRTRARQAPRDRSAGIALKLPPGKVPNDGCLARK